VTEGWPDALQQMMGWFCVSGRVSGILLGWVSLNGQPMQIHLDPSKNTYVLQKRIYGTKQEKMKLSRSSKEQMVLKNPVIPQK
jgi:hypothetical protein